MARDYLAESKDGLVQVCALLTAWADDLKPVDGNADTYSRVLVARQGARDALKTLDEIERCGVSRQPPPD